MSMNSCIALAHEMTNDLNRRVHGGNIVAKLDMSKAYDRVNWSFLLQVLEKFSFSHVWIDFIYRAISACKYTISLNGIQRAFFKSYRGLRQGAIFSP